MGLNIGVIQIRAEGVDAARVERVIAAYWAGGKTVVVAEHEWPTMGLQSEVHRRLGFAISSPEGGWITVADSEGFTADAALARHLADELGVEVAWYTLTASADVGALRIYGEQTLETPGDDEDYGEVQRWAEASFARPTPRFGADTAGPDWTMVGFEGIDAELYVDDPTWLDAAAVDAGAIQIRVKPGIDQEAVVAQVIAYWEQCGATHDDAVEMPEDSCGVIADDATELVVVVSPIIDGWITVLDSEREVADLGLADWLAAELDADVAWYWVASESDTAALRLFGFDELDEEPADDVPSVIGFAQDLFPLPFAPIDLIDATWTKMGFRGVDPEQYVTDPTWLDDAVAAMGEADGEGEES